MDVSNLLTHEGTQQPHDQIANRSQQGQTHTHQYPTRRSMSANTSLDQGYATAPGSQYLGSSAAGGLPPYSVSPVTPTPKNVAFELHLDGASNYRARLPMRVQIFPHDTTDSIVTTVKNFYGIYEGAAKGVSFEDDQGNTLIARYENFKNNMVVKVRVIQDYSTHFNAQSPMGYQPGSPFNASHQDDALQMLPPQPAQILHYGQPPSRPASRVSRKQSASPRLGRGARSTSAQKIRSRSGAKSQGNSFQGTSEDLHSDTGNGCSDSDGGAGSVSSSRKARSEQLASAEISLDNILEGNRRKRAKFESSELPLFVPPQVPAPNSISSISPQRRSNGLENPSPFARPTQRTFAYSQPLHSPQNYGFTDNMQGGPPQGGSGSGSGSPFAVPTANHHGHRLRDRTNTNGPHLTTRSSSGNVPRPNGAGILPTPDPTIASCISDEDVALQLMRLGDASNISHGRTSASTFDDAFSGRADAASSVTSESDNESDTTEQPILPPNQPQLKLESARSSPGPVKRQRKAVHDNLPSFDSTEVSGGEVDDDYEYDDKKEGLVKSDQDEMANSIVSSAKPKLTKARSVNGGAKKPRTGIASTKSSKTSKAPPAVHMKKSKLPVSSGSQPPISPASLPTQSRKTSSASTLNFQHQLRADEDDLSSKPRCQRCRKSKKGCDRQRPCQRCKDAGIGLEGCVSEDEGNGRKGRYGRHMGVPVKKGSEGYIPDNDSQTAGAILTGMAGGQGSPGKSKKRKR